MYVYVYILLYVLVQENKGSPLATKIMQICVGDTLVHATQYNTGPQYVQYIHSTQYNTGPWYTPHSKIQVPGTLHTVQHRPMIHATCP